MVSIKIGSVIFLIAVTVAVALVARADDKQSKLAPEIFAPGVISTDLDELSGSYSPDGKSFYFVRRSAYTTTPPISIICFSELRDGKWSHPEVAPFSGTYLDGSPYFSPDGKKLYFGSKRPTESNPDGGDWKIWFVEKIENGWGAPKEIGSPVNSLQNDTNPAPAADGTLYFTSDRDGLPGSFHIYRARMVNGHYEQPEKLEINTGDAEINPYISPHQKVLIFASYRKDALASDGNLYPRTDLYLSENRDGHWTQARHLEHGINTAATEGNPCISGSWFYFTSERSPFDVPVKKPFTTARWNDQQRVPENGVGNIYRIPVEALELNK
jgi:hypothetical protein